MKNNEVKRATFDFFKNALQHEEVEGVLFDEATLPAEPSNIPLRKARRVVDLYLNKGRTLAGIASAIHLTVDEVREVLHIVNVACKRCESNKVGDVTLVGSVLPLCRKCRKEIDV